MLPLKVAGSTGRCNTISKFTCRSLKAQSLSRALIEAQSYLVEIGLRVTGQVGFLGEVSLAFPTHAQAILELSGGARALPGLLYCLIQEIRWLKDSLRITVQ